VHLNAPLRQVVQRGREKHGLIIWVRCHQQHAGCLQLVPHCVWLMCMGVCTRQCAELWELGTACSNRRAVEWCAEVWSARVQPLGWC
jgi:hypothetical protein